MTLATFVCGYSKIPFSRWLSYPYPKFTLTKTPWLFNQERRIVVSYEDEESLAAKSAYVQQMGLGGVNLWELNYDSESTLISAVYRLFNPALAPTLTP